MPTTRVIIADDQLLVRAGVAALLQSLGDYEVVAQAEDGGSCLLACDQQPADLLLLDVEMPGADGVSVTREVLERHPALRIVILTGHGNADVARRAVAAGARGFVSKDFVLDELAHALRAVRAGRPWISPDIAMAAIAAPAQAVVDPRPAPTAMAAPTGPDHAVPAGARALTPRQREVLAGIARGHSNKVIARHLDISLKTVEYHRAELIQRLDLHDVASLTRCALQLGLVDGAPH